MSSMKKPAWPMLKLAGEADQEAQTHGDEGGEQHAHRQIQLGAAMDSGVSGRGEHSQHDQRRGGDSAHVTPARRPCRTPRGHLSIPTIKMKKVIASSASTDRRA